VNDQGEAAVSDDKDADEPTQEPSESQQSKERSKSFKSGDAGASSTSASAEVQELYRKQAARIEELEKENKEYKSSQEDGQSRLAKAEEELESLRESTSDVAELRSKAKESEKISTELATVQRQLSQAQQAAKGKERRQSVASPEISEQLAKSTSTIESQELEMSNLRNQVNSLTTTLTERETSVKDLEQRATSAEHQAEATKQELDSLKVSMTFGSDANDTDSKSTDDPEALNKRIVILESDLRTAQTTLEAASERATSLEQKIEALTKLHRESSAAVQAKDKELRDVRAELKRRDRPSHVRDASDFDLHEEETETGQLQSRIRALEAENFDLKRGVWRDRRAEMQPGMEEHENGQEYEDVDLNAPASTSPLLARQTSTFQDVISSGISAFTGRARGVASPDQHTGNRPRNQSMGLLSEDGFDEEAFRLAQEEDAKRRIERVKDVKRGLDQWKGWKLDLVDVRAGGIGAGRECGPVFEV
jgi:chromosome segregation ATPase